MLKINKIYLLITALGFLSLSLSAQKKDTKLESENVDIVRDYKPKILDANKMEVIPEQEKLEKKKPEMKYTSAPVLFRTPPYKTNFRSLQISKDEKEKLQHMYVIAGVGNYSNINLDAFYNTLQSKTALLSAQGKFHSGDGPLKNSQFMDALVDLTGKKIMGKNIISGNINYQNNTLHFYGYDHDSLKDVSLASIKQNFSDFTVSGGFDHAKADTGQLRYGIGVSFYNFQDFYKAQENVLSLTGQVIEPFHQNRIIFDASFDYMGYKFLNTYNRNITKVDVNYQFDLDGIRGIAGFRTANESDSGNSTFHLYPNVHIEANLAENAVVIFGDVTGGLQRNTFKSLARENNFVESALDVRNTNNKLKVGGGFKGSLTPNLSYLISAHYETYKNLYFYLNDSLDTKRFITVYDDNTKVFHLHGEAGFAISEQISTSAGFNINSYSLSSAQLDKPFHRPAFDATIGAKYSIENKIILGAEVFALGARYAKEYTTNENITLKPVFDLNLNATYRHSNTLGFFVAMKNLFNQQYQLWNNYPVRGIQIVAGVKVNFL